MRAEQHSPPLLVMGALFRGGSAVLQRVFHVVAVQSLYRATVPQLCRVCAASFRLGLTVYLMEHYTYYDLPLTFVL